MSWGLGWKRPLEIFKLRLNYGTEESGDDLNRTFSSTSSAILTKDSELGFRIELEWTGGEEEEQVALKPQDSVIVKLAPQHTEEDDDVPNVGVEMRVVKRREPLRAVVLTKGAGSGQQSDGTGILTRLLRCDLATGGSGVGAGPGCGDHWKTVTVVSICGVGLSVLPVILMCLPLLEKLYLGNNNKLSVLPPELSQLKTLKVLSVDCNMLVSVPVELGKCVGLVELSLEHNKLIRPLLDFRAMAELRILRLFDGEQLLFWCI